VLIAAVPMPPTATSDDSHQGIGAGLRFIVRHPFLRPFLSCVTVLSFCYGMYFTLLIPFAVRDLHLRPGQIGLAIGAGAGGALAGSILAAKVTRRLGIGGTVILGAFVYAAALLAIPFASRTVPWGAWATIAAAELVSGFGLMLMDINGLSLQQSVTAASMLGRVSGASMASMFGAQALAGLAAAAIGSQLGLGPAIALAAGLGTASIAILFISPIRRLKQLPEQASSLIAEPGG
jgi:MFS family permease